MGYLLKEALKTLCGVNQWSYAVFWKIGCHNPKYVPSIFFNVFVNFLYLYQYCLSACFGDEVEWFSDIYLVVIYGSLTILNIQDGLLSFCACVMYVCSISFFLETCADTCVCLISEGDNVDLISSFLIVYIDLLYCLLYFSAFFFAFNLIYLNLFQDFIIPPFYDEVQSLQKQDEASLNVMLLSLSRFNFIYKSHLLDQNVLVYIP